MPPPPGNRLSWRELERRLAHVAGVVKPPALCRVADPIVDGEGHATFRPIMYTKVALSLLFLCAIDSVAVAEDGPAPKGGAVVKPATPPARPAASTAPAKKFDWEKMNLAERKKYMKATVLPEMKKLFVAYDEKKYKDMTCQTCHGDKATQIKFRMPNPMLPKLPQPTDRAGFMALQQKKPEATNFMGTEVKPKLAALLGLPEAGPTNPKGFGCYDCHTKEGATSAAKEGPPKPAPTPEGAKDPKGR